MKVSGDNVEGILKWGAIGGGVLLLAYWLNRLATPAQEMSDQAGEIGDNTKDPSGVTRAKWYDPTMRTVFFYYLTFPDGNHHFVWNSDVAVDGSFSYDGNNYRIGVDKAGGLRAYSV